MASNLKRCHRHNAQRPSSADQISVAVVVAAAEIIGGNEDLVVNILQRLPAKSLIRFRSVSKTWLFIISSPSFSLLHWQHQHPQFHDPKISGLFFTYGPERFIKLIPLIHFDLMNRCNSCTTINGGQENKPLALFTANAIVVDSCNGFLLICCPSHETKLYHVYNPTTKQFSTIPWSFPPGSTYPGDRVYLVFDPSKSLHYKFVWLRIKLYRGVYLCQMRIYSSETNAWSSPPNICDQHPFQLSVCVSINNGVYCNGSIHWICFSQLETSIYFDVDQQRWCPMPTPPYQVAVFKFWHFGKSRGHLHYINYHDDTGFNLNFYEMESDYSKWTLKYRVDLNPMVADLAAKEEMVVRYDMVSVLSLFHGEDQGDVFLVLFVGTNMIISYNIKDNTFKKLDIDYLVSSSRDLSWFKQCRVHQYIETLLPV